jgi:hypothetical protein
LLGGVGVRGVGERIRMYRGVVDGVIDGRWEEKKEWKY